MYTVTHHGRETAYDLADRGATGEPICFVHGSGGSSNVWKSQHRIADRYPVVAVDLSGHGESDDVDANPGYTTLSAYADDVIAVLEDTDARVLVGNSLGGAITMHILIERADEANLDAAVLTGTGARLGVLEDLRWWLENDFERALEFLHEPNRFFHDPDPRLRSKSLETMRECGQDVIQRDFLTCHQFDVRDRLDAIDVPVLAVYGEHDQLMPPRFHEFLADEIPNGELAEIPDAAHLAMLEQPSAFNEALVSFLDATIGD
ncbi:alpha/beta fold hydrolase [Natronosalvus vescus]|uniref:alpha/beta fold hydrolase n=1 Tax=Natronosalvus vescus TaxID=2953881 RepID=UPI0020903084|nr:alpha/beta hydrolase [Natronosalvus vescus]